MGTSHCMFRAATRGDNNGSGIRLENAEAVLFFIGMKNVKPIFC